MHLDTSDTRISSLNLNTCLHLRRFSNCIIMKDVLFICSLPVRRYSINNKNYFLSRNLFEGRINEHRIDFEFVIHLPTNIRIVNEFILFNVLFLGYSIYSGKFTEHDTKYLIVGSPKYNESGRVSIRSILINQGR